MCVCVYEACCVCMKYVVYVCSMSCLCAVVCVSEVCCVPPPRLCPSTALSKHMSLSDRRFSGFF